MNKTQFLSAICLLCISFSATAIQHKTLSSVDGLSNNAIMSIHQNSLGHIYIGTADGLNIWNGHSMETFQAADGFNYFYGNMIRHIFPFGNEKIYFQTNYGLAILDTITKDMEFFSELMPYYRMTVTDDGNIFALDKQNILHHFDITTRKLTILGNFFIPSNEKCHRMITMSNGRICVFSDSDTYLISIAERKDETPGILEIRNLNLKCRFVAPSFDGRTHSLITKDNTLYSFDTTDCSVERISEIEDNLISNSITGILKFGKKYYISFLQQGMYVLNPESKILEQTDIDCGIFTIMPDKRQPVIWVGTDCNGLIRFNPKGKNIDCITYDRLPYSLRMPVRCLFLDEKNNLWFGTKGDGLYRIKDFEINGNFSQNKVNRFTVENSDLVHNNIYAIIKGNDGNLWIGTEGNGICRWSEARQRISKVRGSENIRMIHSMIEQNDTTLWVATDGYGSYRCRLRHIHGEPVIEEIDTLQFSEPFNMNTLIFTMSMQNDSTIWFGSRGNGALSYNMNTKKSRIIQFPTYEGFAINEIFYISKGEDMLFATGNGLVTYDIQNDTIHISDFIPKRATHAIVNDKEGNVWVSTNSGIYTLDNNYNYIEAYDRFSGIEVIEYSDGACYSDTTRNLVFFGGINGITVIDQSEENYMSASPYIPEINITDFIQNNESSHISLKMKNGKLKIPYTESIFAIGFSVVDNLNYSDYEFSYNIEGLTDEWITNENNIIYIPPVSPGKYRLRIRYLNRSTSHMSEECSLPIYIIPPFYKSWWAYILYGILAALAVCMIISYYRKRNARMKERIHNKYKDEILNIKSNTTSTITEELSVQITFILALCQQIRQQAMNNPFIASKVNLVEYNIAKINKILQILNEYKGISDTMITSSEVSLLPVSQITNEILDLMSASTKVRKVTLSHNIENGITLPINKEGYLTLVYSLVYKVISIATGKKQVSLHINRSEKGGIMLETTVTADKGKYFALESAFSHNEKEEFELFLCNMIVNKIGGNISYSYNDDIQLITINIYLPSHKVEENNVTFADSYISESINTYNTLIENELPRKFKPNSTLSYIYLISNNRDISSFLGYFLSEKYNILIFKNNEAAIAEMENRIPAAVIFDVSSIMSSLAGFIESMKGNRRTEQVAIIALTSSMQITEREECTKLGADLCISFPFNIDYLNSALTKLLLKKESAAEYYKSPFSTYVIDDGKVIHQEDKSFINKIFQIINDNISNPALTAPAIAKQLGISTRVMYRRLENITEKKLHQVIKETRMQHATKLLTSSKYTIDEIMYRVGYDNRSTFYRNFKDIYGKTPKEYREEVHNDTMKELSSKEN